jgi:prepilin-type N-terminal cleavage/methylation domain-containing protein
MRYSHDKNAFTLIELLVVVAIIALLVGVLIPVLRKARYQTRMAYCTSHLRRIGVAITAF